MAEPRVMVLGVGNLLLGDDGFGVHVAQQLQERADADATLLPEGTTILDGGTFGLDLEPRLDGVTRLVIVDAVQTDKAPGTVGVWHGDDAARIFGHPMSVHQVGVDALLGALQLLGRTPPEVVLVGVAPESLEVSTDLTPVVAEQLDEALRLVVEASWGRA